MKFANLMLAFLVISVSPLYSQNDKQCGILEKFLNFPEVFSNFRLDDKMDSLVIINKNKVFNVHFCALKLEEKVLIIKYDSILTEQVSKKDPYFLFKDNCKVLILSEDSSEKSVHSLSLLQPCSNSLTEAKIRVKGRKVKMISIKKYVL